MNSNPMDNPPSYEEAIKINPNAQIPSISSKVPIIVEQPKPSAPALPITELPIELPRLNPTAPPIEGNSRSTQSD